MLLLSLWSFLFSFFFLFFLFFPLINIRLPQGGKGQRNIQGKPHGLAMLNMIREQQDVVTKNRGPHNFEQCFTDYEICCSGRRIWQGRDAIFGCLDSAGRLVAAKYSVHHPPLRPPMSAPAPGGNLADLPSNERPSLGRPRHLRPLRPGSVHPFLHLPHRRTSRASVFYVPDKIVFRLARTQEQNETRHPPHPNPPKNGTASRSPIRPV